MNKIGKWTGIALLGASVIAFDVAALSVAFGAAREFKASPEAHAVGVATRIVARAVVHQVVGEAVRVAGDLRWAGIHGAPVAIAEMAMGADPDPNLELGVEPDPKVTILSEDGDVKCAVAHARCAMAEMRCQLQNVRAMRLDQVRVERRDQVRARVRAAIQRLMASGQTL